MFMQFVQELRRQGHAVIVPLVMYLVQEYMLERVFLQVDTKNSGCKDPELILI